MEVRPFKVIIQVLRMNVILSRNRTKMMANPEYCSVPTIGIGKKRMRRCGQRSIVSRKGREVPQLL